MDQRSIHSVPDFDTLYRKYWPCVLRFCTRRLATCPDGLAEEVAQDVFLAVQHALQEQRYREEGAFSAWLLSIARHLCSKAARESYRQTSAPVVRALAREMACWEYAGGEHLQARLQKHLHEAAHGAPPMSPGRPR